MKRLLQVLFVLTLVLALTACATRKADTSLSGNDVAGTQTRHNAQVTADESTETLAETKPIETKPAETKPAETKPAEIKPAETKPAEIKPAETKPAETKPAETKPATTVQNITKDEAKAIAFAHAKVAASEVEHVEIEKDRENGKTVYDISFYTANGEYDYEIDALSGNVINYAKESKPVAAKTAAEAKTIALNHAGVSLAEARELEAEKDTHKGKPVYEVSFTAGGYEYEYTISGETGNVLHQEKERD